MKRTAKYVGLDVHQATTVASVRDASGRVIARTILPTEGATLVEFFRGMRGTVRVAFEEGTQAQWLHDLRVPVAHGVIVCDRRGERRRRGNKADQVDADDLSHRLRTGDLRAVYHGSSDRRLLHELTRTYVNVVEDATRTMQRLKALFRARAVRASGERVYAPRYRKEWLAKLEDRGARFRAEVLFAELDLLRELRPRAEGLEGLLQDHARSGRPKQITASDEEAMIKKTLETKPPNGTHWSTRIMAREMGWDPTTVARIWRSHGIKPHLICTFKLSKDPHVVEKLRAVVGLYLDPPDRSVVFAVDEKRQIQALDRTQPGLPLKKGRAGTRTHDYMRHGTTSLFAGLEVKTGSVVHECMPRHRAAEFLRFARKVVRSVPKELDVYFILDNVSTHKTSEVMRWLARNTRVHFYFVPTSASGRIWSSACSANSPSESCVGLSHTTSRS